MTWNPIELPTDQILLADHLSPGICEVIGAASDRKWDELDGYAMSGGILIFRGIKLSHFTIQLSLYTVEHWNAWQEFRPILARPPLGRVVRALSVVHPVLNEVGINALVIESVGAPTQTEDGVWGIAIQCIEWRRLRPALGKPDGVEETPADPWDLKIDDLTKQRDALANDPGNL